MSVMCVYRCFPSCRKNGHVVRGFCGQALVVQFTVSREHGLAIERNPLMVVAEIHSTNVVGLGACQKQFKTPIAPDAIFSNLRCNNNINKNPLFSGGIDFIRHNKVTTLVQCSFNTLADSWNYGWPSNRWNTESHVVDIVLFGEVKDCPSYKLVNPEMLDQSIANNILFQEYYYPIGMFTSNEFTISCTKDAQHNAMQRAANKKENLYNRQEKQVNLDKKKRKLSDTSSCEADVRGSEGNAVSNASGLYLQYDNGVNRFINPALELNANSLETDHSRVIVGLTREGNTSGVGNTMQHLSCQQQHQLYILQQLEQRVLEGQLVMNLGLANDNACTKYEGGTAVEGMRCVANHSANTDSAQPTADLNGSAMEGANNSSCNVMPSCVAGSASSVSSIESKNSLNTLSANGDIRSSKIDAVDLDVTESLLLMSKSPAVDISSNDDKPSVVDLKQTQAQPVPSLGIRAAANDSGDLDDLLIIKPSSFSFEHKKRLERCKQDRPDKHDVLSLPLYGAHGSNANIGAGAHTKITPKNAKANVHHHFHYNMSPLSAEYHMGEIPASMDAVDPEIRPNLLTTDKPNLRPSHSGSDGELLQQQLLIIQKLQEKQQVELEKYKQLIYQNNPSYALAKPTAMKNDVNVNPVADNIDSSSIISKIPVDAVGTRNVGRSSVDHDDAEIQHFLPSVSNMLPKPL